MTPFGNITTDPRLVHLTGEKLIFSCHNGDDDQKLSKEGNPILRPSMSDDNDDHQSEPQPKPLRQLIIISGRPMNKINDNDNNDKDDGKDLVKSIKNNGPPSGPDFGVCEVCDCTGPRASKGPALRKIFFFFCFFSLYACSQASSM